MQNQPEDLINTEDELRELLGYPSELVRKKAISRLDRHCKDFIAKSPLIFIGTSSKEGLCDVSPRGDAPGFVETLEDHYLVIPERPGNKRCDSLSNILSNPQIGIIFLIPGLKETLRVNGKAIISREAKLLGRHQVNGKIPRLAIIVEVEECYIHCAKAFIRSELWNKETWLPENDLPKIPQILADHVSNESYPAHRISDALKESYKERLY
ncbi:pyridoxamine 5'-phosphate oxidase family protein [Sabulibacter ruber]|uniref:pyridoxamine 5'-phosphate oxidase family protein n=1 Tax=Sabulibacter ruber TaxID=2811901 RepID=UPI001A968757|nr:pyridoxamine 5'-phosphate oxidase family protein [Sabulibacter ruber]